METDQYIDVADGNLFTAKQTGEVQIKMRGNSGKPFIAALYDLLVAPDFCNRLFPLLC